MNISITYAVNLANHPHLSKEDLKKCRLPEGFPFLIDDDKQQIVEPVLLFLAKKYLDIGNRYVRNSALAACQDLADWWMYLDYGGLRWDEVCSNDVRDYRNTMIEGVSPYTHEPYSLQTIRRRLTSILAFYDYAKAREWIDQELNEKHERKRFLSIDSVPLAHTHSGRQKTEHSTLMPKRSSVDDDVRAFNLRQYPLFAQHLGPLPLDADGSEGARADLRSCRNRLWAELCLHTGMRPEEPARISKYAILDLTPDDPDNPLGKTYLKITGKRKVTRKVELPNFLLNWLVWYIKNERQDAVKEGLRRGSIKKNEPVNLFLNGPSARHNAGRPMSYKTFYDEFHRAGLSAGLTETTAKVDPDTGEQYFTQEPMFSPHCLRHTFAVWTYFFERKNGNTEPWKKIQALLGHRHLSTTMNIYLRISGELEATMSDRVVGHFGSGLYDKI